MANLQLIDSVVTITFYTYRAGFGWLGFLAMGWLRLPLTFNRKVAFWKLMGVGQSGFQPHGDSRKWAVLIVWRGEPDENTWWQQCMRATAEAKSFYLQPLFGHGLWDGVDPFASTISTSTPSSRIAVLTRASIRWSK